MKRITLLLAVAAIALSALPAHANNWQWQLDHAKVKAASCTCQGKDAVCARRDAVKRNATSPRAEVAKS